MELDQDFIFQILTSTVVVGVVTVCLNAFFNRRKLGAEATSIITQAASGVVKNLEDDNARLRAKSAENAIKLEQYENESRARDAEMRVFTDAFEAHLRHDALVARALAGAGITVPDPPPLPRLTPRS